MSNRMADLMRIEGILAFARRLFGWIVRERAIRDPHLAMSASESVSEVNRRLSAVQDRLAMMRHAGELDPELLRRLEQNGLTGAQLQFKIDVFDWLVSGRRGLRKILAWLNNLLGSLVSVFPPLEAAKEWKEGVELVVRHQRHLPHPPASVLNLEAEDE